MDETKKLIIPEINGHLLTKSDKIIANPNCSTIQMLMVLSPIHKKYNIQRIVVSTYQSITGTGMKAVKQLKMNTMMLKEKWHITIEFIKTLYLIVMIF